MTTYYPGTRVLVFDPRLFRDDKATPLTHTMRPATVVRWYGYRSPRFGKYPNNVDVLFDHDGRESRGHFADGMEVIR